MLWPCKFLACWDPVTLWCTTFEWSETCHRFYIPPPLNMSPFKCTYVMYHPHDIYGLFYLILILGLASNALQWCSTFEWSETFWALWQLLMHCLFMKWPFEPWSLMNFCVVLPYSYSGPGIHWCTTLEWSDWDTLNTGYICVYPYLTSITLPSFWWHFWVVVNLPPLHSWWYPSLMCVEI